MRLMDFMADASIDDESFATMVGGVTRHAVKKWKYGERIPPVAQIIRIEDVTKGKVTLRDWQVEGSVEEHSAPASPEAA